MGGLTFYRVIPPAAYPMMNVDIEVKHVGVFVFGPLTKVTAKSTVGAFSLLEEAVINKAKVEYMCTLVKGTRTLLSYKFTLSNAAKNVDFRTPPFITLA